MTIMRRREFLLASASAGAALTVSIPEWANSSEGSWQYGAHRRIFLALCHT